MNADLLKFLSSEDRAAYARCEKATAGPWRYRPNKYSDWGTVYCDEPRYGTATFHLCQVRDPRNYDEHTHNEHRKARTDPWKDNAIFVAESRTDIPRLAGRLAKANKFIADFVAHSELIAQANSVCPRCCGKDEHRPTCAVLVAKALLEGIEEGKS